MGILERKVREKEQRRLQILNAGEKLIVFKGLENTTMDEIAKICELSKGTLYLYYKSKEEIFISLKMRSTELFIKMLNGQFKKNDPPDKKLGMIGETYLNFYKKHPYHFRIMNQMENHFFEKSHKISELEAELFIKGEKIWELIINIITEGVEQGIYRKDINPYKIGIILWASSNGIIQIMDHIETYHKNTISLYINKEVHANNFTCEVYKMKLEEVLRESWKLTLSSIIKKTKNK